MSKSYIVVGLMSGTSLDGLDIALTRFWNEAGKWRFQILAAETRTYSEDLGNRLRNSIYLKADELIALDRSYGKYIGEQLVDFLKDCGETPNLIASHGHTVFHQPQKGFTLQIGSGCEIAAKINIPVVADFRSMDVALGGQGAPLVPIGDEFLFGEFDSCLNLGGFSNVSFRVKDKRVAFDICPVNIVLNSLAMETGLAYDAGGEIAASGKVNLPLLNALNELRYYQETFPKSLGKEWLDAEFMPLLSKFDLSVSDKMRTVTEHVAVQIKNSLSPYELKEILVTGGGALNNFLIERIKTKLLHVMVPDLTLINYKEAVVFAFLGLLRYLGKVNCLSSVTGASRNSVCGSLYL